MRDFLNQARAYARAFRHVFIPRPAAPPRRELTEEARRLAELERREAAVTARELEVARREAELSRVARTQPWKLNLR